MKLARLQSGEGSISELRDVGCRRLVFRLDGADGWWTDEELDGWWTYEWVVELLGEAPMWVSIQPAGQRRQSFRMKNARKSWLARVLPAVEEDPETRMKVVDAILRLGGEAAVLEWAEARYADKCERARVVCQAMGLP